MAEVRSTSTDVSAQSENNKTRWIDAETGTRSDVPHHYIYPQSTNENLTVLTGFHVKRVIFRCAAYRPRSPLTNNSDIPSVAVL